MLRTQVVRLALRYVVYPAIAGVAIAYVIGQKTARGYLDFVIASLIFGVSIGAAIESMRRWIRPRLISGPGAALGGPLGLELVVLFAAAMIGASLAAVIVNFTIAPGYLFSVPILSKTLLLAFLVVSLAIGVSYAGSFRSHFLERVRSEAEYKARVELEMRTASEIQQALLPRAGHSAAGFELAGATLPSRAIAGDFFDFFELPGGSLCFTVGDIAGKGPPAAILAAAVQGMITAAADTSPTPRVTIERVNRALVRRAIESRFTTVFHGTLAPGGRLVACNAGHNPAILLRSDGSVRRLAQGGLVLGVFAEAVYEDEEVALTPRDTLVVFSDGVTEAASPERQLFGDERVLECLKDTSELSAQQLVERLLSEVRSFTRGLPPEDDITVLVLKGIPSRPELTPNDAKR